MQSYSHNCHFLPFKVIFCHIILISQRSKFKIENEKLKLKVQNYRNIKKLLILNCDF